MIVHCHDISTFSMHVVGYTLNCNCATSDDIELMIDVLNHPSLSDIPLELDLINCYSQKDLVPREDNYAIV